MMIHKIANYITKSVMTNIDEGEKEISDYAFQKRISLVLIHVFLFLSLIIFGIVTEDFQSIILSAIIFFFIRTISGGNHLDSPDACFFVTLFAILIIPLSQDFLPSYHSFYLFIVVMAIYLCLSPHNSSSKIEWILAKSLIVTGLMIGYTYDYRIVLIYIALIPDLLYLNENFNNKKFR